MSWWSSWGDSKSNTQTSQDPWAPAKPALNSILGGLQPFANNPGPTSTETGALGGLQSLANAGNPYATGISTYAHEALGGGPDRTGTINDAYANYLKETQGTANGDYLDPNKNPWFSNVTQTIGNDVQNRLTALYAGSGRDPAGAGNFGYNLSRGVSEGVAPVFSNIYEQERQRQEQARTGRFAAGGQATGLLSGLDTQRFANMGQGAGAANSALTAANSPFTQTLAIEAQRRGIPLSLMQQLAGIATPIAGLGGTGTSSTQNQASGMQQFNGLMSGLSTMFSGSGGGSQGKGLSAAQQIAQMMGGVPAPA